MPEFTQLDSVKSMMRYLPANGTAGLARCADRTLSRSPCPPARITAATFRMAMLSQSVPAATHLQDFEEHRVDVPEQPPHVGDKRLPRHRAVGYDVGEDRKLGGANDQAGRRLGNEAASLGKRNEGVVPIVHQVDVRVNLGQVR